MGKAALIMVMGLMVCFGLFGRALNRTSQATTENVVGDYEQTMVRNIASSGASMALHYLGQDIHWREGWTNRAMLGGTSTTVLEDEEDDASLGRGVVRITSTATCGDRTDTTVVLWRRVPFSEYAYFTNVESNIWFITGDTLAGPVHTNGTLHMYGSPVFQGRVTSPNMWVSYPGYPATPQFLGGSDFNHEAITLPISFDEIQSAAADGGLLFYQNAWLSFQPDGTVQYAYSASGPWTTVDLSTMNGAIWSTGDLHVEGTLDGRATVGAAGNVWIEDNIIYAADPRVGSSDDLLGIVSENQVIVADNTANRNDCIIHASIMALDKFTVEHYSSPPPRGTLSLLGGLIQDHRGPVGTFSYYGIYSGYQKNYQYDGRMMSDVPPFFPLTTDEKEVVSWYE